MLEDTRYSDFFRAERESARKLAETELYELGFTYNEELNRWSGVLPGLSKERVELVLPDEFPETLPDVFLKSLTSGVRAHVEASGEICVASNSNLLLDVSRPAALIREVLERADSALSTSEDDRELDAEFLAYWAPNGIRVLSIVPPETNYTEVVLAEVQDFSYHRLLAPNTHLAESFGKAIGSDVKVSEKALWVKIQGLPRPPGFTQALSLKKLLRLLKSNGANEKRIKEWLCKNELPAWIVVSAKSKFTDERVVFGATVLKLSKKAERKGGFRSGKLPGWLRIKRCLPEPVQRIQVHRGDVEFLTQRGGASSELSDKSVCVVGCGAVGSYVVSALAEAGVGFLTLVDPERLSPDNIHRHLLGMKSVGEYKCEGIRDHLQRQYPLTSINAIPRRVEDVLDNEQWALTNSQILVFALGEETLELRINRMLHSLKPRIHTWIEPLGLGGHALTVGLSQSGCFECLYRRDSEFGLLSMANLVAPGQDFRRTFAGCTGSYTPFSGLHARAVADRVAAQAIKVLTGRKLKSSLISWIIDEEPFRHEKFRLSLRGEKLIQKRDTEIFDFCRPDCPVCGSEIWLQSF